MSMFLKAEPSALSAHPFGRETVGLDQWVFMNELPEMGSSSQLHEAQAAVLTLEG